MHEFSEFLKELSRTATSGQVRVILLNGSEELPTTKDEQLGLLMVCQTELWRREGASEAGATETVYDRLRALRDQLLG